jgi:hypothetical protein
MNHHFGQPADYVQQQELYNGFPPTNPIQHLQQNNFNPLPEVENGIFYHPRAQEDNHQIRFEMERYHLEQQKNDFAIVQFCWNCLATNPFIGNSNTQRHMRKIVEQWATHIRADMAQRYNIPDQR